MSTASGHRRVVITGLGAVTAFGRGAMQTWRAIVDGRSGITARHPFENDLHPLQVAGYVDLACLEGFEREKNLGRAAQFGLAAGLDAYADANLARGTPHAHKIGVCLGASTFPVIEDRLDRLGSLLDGARWNAQRYAQLCRERPWLLAQSDAASISSLLSDRLGLEGPSITVQAACTSATQAIGHAFHSLRAGQGTVMLAGGTDSMLSMMCVTGFALLGSLAQRWSSPTQASRPFDRTRDGFVVAEGATVLVLEELDHALTRGARIYAELLGYGSSCDAYRFTDMQPEGRGAVLCMQAALGDAQVLPEQVGYINAHGTATPLNDRIETHAIRQVFETHADRGLAISSTKSQLGHLLCAAGAVELMATALALYDKILPPTINLENPDPECDLDYIPGFARPAEVNVAMSNSFGFGGQNGSLVLRRWPPPAESSRAGTIPSPRAVSRRVCLTGIGVHSPVGLDVSSHILGWREGHSGIAATATPEMQVLGIPHAGRVPDFDPYSCITNRMLRKILTRAAGFAVVAAGEALHSSGLPTADIEKLGLFVGSLGLDQDLNTFGEALRYSLESAPEGEPSPSESVASNAPPERFSYSRFHKHGMSLIDPLFLLKSLPNAGLCGAAIEHGMQGPNLNVMNGSTSGLLAVSAAADSILRGDTPVALAGGYDSLVQLETVLAHLIDGRLLTGEASGYLPGEGAVFFVLEEETHARARGAHIFAEIGGSAVAHSPPDAIPNQSAATVLERVARASGATEQWTQQASCTAPNAVFGDGLNLAAHDALEVEVLRRMACGRRDIPLQSTVSRLGFAGAATGLFSLLHAALTIDGQLPFTDGATTGQLPEKLLVWTSDRGRDHVAVTLRRHYTAGTEVA